MICDQCQPYRIANEWPNPCHDGGLAVKDFPASVLRIGELKREIRNETRSAYTSLDVFRLRYASINDTYNGEGIPLSGDPDGGRHARKRGSSEAESEPELRPRLHAHQVEYLIEKHYCCELLPPTAPHPQTKPGPISGGQED